MYLYFTCSQIRNASLKKLLIQNRRTYEDETFIYLICVSDRPDGNQMAATARVRPAVGRVVEATTQHQEDTIGGGQLGEQRLV